MAWGRLDGGKLLRSYGGGHLRVPLDGVHCGWSSAWSCLEGGLPEGSPGGVCWKWAVDGSRMGVAWKGSLQGNLCWPPGRGPIGWSPGVHLRTPLVSFPVSPAYVSCVFPCDLPRRDLFWVSPGGRTFQTVSEAPREVPQWIPWLRQLGWFTGWSPEYTLRGPLGVSPEWVQGKFH
jgi:hypothetical protein